MNLSKVFKMVFNIYAQNVFSKTIKLQIWWPREVYEKAKVIQEEKSLNKKFDNQEINSYVSEQICKV